MRNKWVFLGLGVVLGAIVAPKLRAWVPSLPSVGR
jgi:hypothetical protein